MINNDQIKEIQSRIDDLHKYLQIDKKKIEIANDDEKPQLLNSGTTRRSRSIPEATPLQEKWVEAYEEIHTQFEDLQVLMDFAREDPDSEKSLMKLFHN